MILYTKNITFCIDLDNFWFEKFGGWEKNLFCTTYFYFNKGNKKIVFGWKLNLESFINTKSQNLQATLFSVKFIFEHKNKFANKKGTKIFISNLCFCLWKKVYHTIFIFENYMISLFSTVIKIMSLISKMTSILHIII